MESVSNTVTNVKQTLLSQGTTTQSGTEPPNAQQGKGTIESPYDSGNAPEQPVGQGVEPPNAQQGKGTVDSAYDQGNQPGMNLERECSRNIRLTLHKKTQPRQPHQPRSRVPIPQTIHLPRSKQKEFLKNEAGQKQNHQLRLQRKVGTSAKPKEMLVRDLTPRLHDLDYKSGQDGLIILTGLNLERSVSPGQLDDGTHVRTSGDKGQSYEPGSNTMGKLKGKLFGKH
jgi:hypothetical protein